MGETHQSSSTDAPHWASFDALIPDCNWRVVEPYHLPIEAGIRAEQARLSGKQWLVAAVVRELDWDGFFDIVRLDAGFVDIDEALDRAALLQAELVEETREKLIGIEPETVPAEWPVEGALAGRPVYRVEPASCFHPSMFDYHGPRWMRFWIYVAILPIDPALPFTAELLKGFEPYGSELQRYFGEIGESLGVDVEPPRSPVSSAPTTPYVSPPQPRKSSSFQWWRLLPWVVLGAGLLIMIAVGQPGKW